MDTADQRSERTGDNREAGSLARQRTRKLSEGHVERPYVVLIPALIVVLSSALDLTVIAPILPSILFDLNINTAEADRYVWIVSGYLLAYTITIPLMGRLSDAVGRRPIFMLAQVVFLIGSVICAISTDLWTLVLGRTIQGLGGGAMVPVAMALVGDLLPAARRAAALGLVAAIETLGWVLGPIWGAAFAHLFGSWRAVFWLNIPIGIVAALVLIYAWRQPAPRRQSIATLDFGGAALLTVALICISLGFSAGAEGVTANGGRAMGASPNPLSAYQIPILLLGIVAIAGLIAAELRARNPLIPLSLFQNRLFTASNVANTLVGAALMVAMVNVPLFVTLLETQARSSIVSAVLLSAFSFTMGIAAFAGGRITERAGYRLMTIAGLLVAAFGFWQLSNWPNEIEIGSMAFDLAIAGAGFGLVIAPIGAAAINAARQRDLGIASGMVIVMRLLGMTVGISALTGWAVSRLNTALTQLSPPPQRAGETLVEYFERQQEFATNQAIPLTLGIVRDTYAVAGVICLLALIPALLLARRNQAKSEPD